MMTRCVVFLTCTLLWTAHAPAAHFEHGEAIVLSPEAVKALTGPARVAAQSSVTFTNGQISNFSVDTQDRAEVVSLYHCIYQASEGFETRMNWVGNIGSCWEGTVSSAFHDDTLRRIHYYRAMTGLGTGITLDPVKNAKCQKAALIMARNNGLSHHPIAEHPTWSCLTTDGDEAAGKSNISLGSPMDYTGPRAVDGQIRDNGSSNVPVGHRRWLLYPPAQEMGNGGIPWVSGYSAAAAVWVIGDFGTRPPSPTWVGWPNPGYVPYDLVPARWSLSMPNADFDNATVTMTHDGSPVSVTKIHPTPSWPAAGYGDYAIVWEPTGIPSSAPVTDDTYSVTVSGITGGISNSVSYSVTLIDPYRLNEEVLISGPDNPHAFMDNLYTFTPVDAADAYHLRIRKIAASTWLEGAEDSPTPQIIDVTDSGYPLRQSSVVRTGSKAFHMALPAFDDQLFEIDRDIVPADASELTFAFRRRWTDEYNELKAQVSDNDGFTWTDVWVTNGVCPNGGSCSSLNWDAAWIPVSQSLGAYAGQPIRLRFMLAANGWSYGGVDDGYGVFIDDIQVTQASEEVSLSETNLAGDATSFVLQPDGVYTYIMDMSAELGCHAFDYGPVTTVSSVPGLWISRIEEQDGQMVIGFDVTGGTYAAHSLYKASDPPDDWSEDTGAAYNAGQREFTTPSAGHMLYHVTGDQ